MNTTPGIRSRKARAKPIVGTWDYDGSCAAKEDGTGRYGGQQNFSLACFQWVAMERGNGVKRAKAAKRFSGPIIKAAEVYAKAEAFCAEREKTA